MKTTRVFFRSRFACFFVALLGLCADANATDLVFDLAGWCCICTPDKHFCQIDFDAVNWRTNATKPNGHFLMEGVDTRRPAMWANGNDIVQYYNSLNTGWTTNSAATRAQQIDNAARNNMTHNGPKPDWVILNEISAGTWPGNATYRQWVIDVCNVLRVTYGRNVGIYSPFQNPGANDASWQALAAEAWIIDECYLSGKEIRDAGFSQAWCETQYQNSKNSYLARGVPVDRLMLVEYYSNSRATNDAGTAVGWGRAGVAYDEWETAIRLRTAAFLNVGFAGYHSYGWSENGMLVSDDERLHFENVYAGLMGASPPDAPTDLAATASSSDTIDLTWTDNSNNEELFEIWRADSITWTYEYLTQVGLDTTSYSDTGLWPDTTYFYTIWSYNATGYSDASNEATATTWP